MSERLSITLSEAIETEPTPSLLAVDRALSDLRRGQILALVGAQDTTLVLAAEGATKRSILRMKNLSEGQPRLVLTPRRVATLGLGHFDGKAVGVNMGKSLRPDLIEGLTNPLAEFSKNDLFDVTFEATPENGGEAAAITLNKLAQLLPAAICVAITKPDDIESWGQQENIIWVNCADIFDYEQMAARSLRAVSEARVPLADAQDTKIVAFRPADGGIEHFAIIIGEPDPRQPVLIRIHSECFTGDLVGSLRCDCGEQLRGAIQAINTEGSGILLYLAQEGRGIGLVNKLRAYKLQDRGLDTFDANEQIGFDADERIYLPAAQMLTHMGVSAVKLMTNNPDKVAALEKWDVTVAERVVHAFESNTHNEPYLKAKADKGGHYL